MAVESACIPLPSEIILPFAGYLASTGRLELLLAATAGAIGSLGRYIPLDRDDLDRAERFFHRFGGPAVFIGRLLSVVRTFIAFPAGIARMPKLKFQLTRSPGHGRGASGWRMSASLWGIDGIRTRSCAPGCTGSTWPWSVFWRLVLAGLSGGDCAIGTR